MASEGLAEVGKKKEKKNKEGHKSGGLFKGIRKYEFISVFKCIIM